MHDVVVRLSPLTLPYRRYECMRPRVTGSEAGVDIYNLTKYTRSNQNTNINQRPLVKAGDTIRVEMFWLMVLLLTWASLALGRNVLIAFMPWNGYNFEDSILISEKLVKEDVYTTIHIRRTYLYRT